MKPQNSIVYHSPIGNIIITATDTKLIGLKIDNTKQQTYCNTADNKVLKQTIIWLDAYFNTKNPSIKDIPLLPQGTTFQQRVWKELLNIPYGSTTTYGAIARKIATDLGKSKMSAQAVGRAVGKNPIAIIIPCHRVVGADGSLVGFAWGLNAKKFLLDLEKNTKQKNIFEKH